MKNLRKEESAGFGDFIKHGILRISEKSRVIIRFLILAN